MYCSVDNMGYIVTAAKAVGQSCIWHDRSCQGEARETRLRSVSFFVMKIQKVEFLHIDAHISAIRTDRAFIRKSLGAAVTGLSVEKPRKSSGTNGG